VEIREARPKEYVEAGRVTALAYRAFAPPDDQDWQEYLGRIADVAGRAEVTTVLVAVEGGRVLGSATLELDEKVPGSDAERVLPPDEANLRMLGVDPAVQGRGVGRALVAACMDLARSRGKRVLTLSTTRVMVVARALYERMGFEATPERDRHFDDPGWWSGTEAADNFVLKAYRYPLDRTSSDRR
jgi:ribosomal protein S18 acetylase RimI-like enzyme